MSSVSEAETIERVLSTWKPGVAVHWRHGEAEPQRPQSSDGWFEPDELAEVAERLVARHPERVYDADEQSFVDEQRLECEIRGRRFVAVRHVDRQGQLLSVVVAAL